MVDSVNFSANVSSFTQGVAQATAKLEGLHNVFTKLDKVSGQVNKDSEIFVKSLSGMTDASTKLTVSLNKDSKIITATYTDVAESAEKAAKKIADAEKKVAQENLRSRREKLRQINEQAKSDALALKAMKIEQAEIIRRNDLVRRLDATEHRDRVRNLKESLKARVDHDKAVAKLDTERQQRQAQRRGNVAQQFARANADRDILGSTVFGLEGGVSRRADASLVEQNRAEKSLARLNELVKKHNTNLRDVQRIWSEVTTKQILPYEGNLRKIQSAVIDIVNSESKLGEGVRKARGASEAHLPLLERMSKGIQKIFLGWDSVFRIFAIQGLHILIANAIGAIREGTQHAIELSKALAEVQTISQSVRGNVESTAQWLKVATELSNKFGVDVAKVLETAYQALSDQIIKTSEDFRVFGEEVTKFALVTKTTSDSAGKLAASILNSFKLPLSELNDVLASTFEAINIGRFRAEEISDSLGTVGVLAHQVGLNFKELQAFLALVTIRGVKADEAMTQLRSLFSDLIKPTKDLSEFLNSLGFESGEAAIKSLGLIGFLKTLQTNAKGSTTELAKSINNVRGLNAAITGVTSIDELAKAYDRLSNAAENYERAQKFVFESTGQRATRFITIFKNEVNSIGKSLLSTGVNVVDFFGDLGDNIEQIAVTAGLLRPKGSRPQVPESLKGPEQFIADTEKRLVAITKEDEARRKAFDKENERIERNLTASIQAENLKFASVQNVLSKEVKARQDAEKTILESVKESAEKTKELFNDIGDNIKSNISEFSSSIKSITSTIKQLRDERLKTIFDWGLEQRKGVQAIRFIQQQIGAIRRQVTQAFLSGDTTQAQELGKDELSLLKQAADQAIEARNKIIEARNKPRKKGGSTERSLITREDVLLASQANNLQAEFQRRSLDYENQFAILKEQQANSRAREATDARKLEEIQKGTIQAQKESEEFLKRKDKGFDTLVDAQKAFDLEKQRQEAIIKNNELAAQVRRNLDEAAALDPNSDKFIPEGLERQNELAAIREKFEKDILEIRKQQVALTNLDAEKQLTLIQLKTNAEQKQITERFDSVTKQRDAAKADLEFIRNTQTLLQKGSANLIKEFSILKDKSLFDSIKQAFPNIQGTLSSLQAGGQGLSNKDLVTLRNQLDIVQTTGGLPPDLASALEKLVDDINKAVERNVVPDQFATARVNLEKFVDETNKVLSQMVPGIKAPLDQMVTEVNTLGKIVDTLPQKIKEAMENVVVQVAPPNQPLGPSGVITKSGGGVIPGFARGGMTDTVLAWLTPGEFVVKADVTRRLLPFLKMLNSNVFPQLYRSGQNPFGYGPARTGGSYGSNVLLDNILRNQRRGPDWSADFFKMHRRPQYFAEGGVVQGDFRSQLMTMGQGNISTPNQTIGNQTFNFGDFNADLRGMSNPREAAKQVWSTIKVLIARGELPA